MARCSPLPRVTPNTRMITTRLLGARRAVFAPPSLTPDAMPADADIAAEPRFRAATLIILPILFRHFHHFRRRPRYFDER
jgi:hypothetical protein